MAPDPKKHSTKKGNARTYLCSACGVRHASPTGAKCVRNAKRSGEDDTSSVEASQGKRHRTNYAPTQPDPPNQVQSSDDESMSEMFARLDGPLFPTGGPSVDLETNSHLSADDFGVSHNPTPGPSDTTGPRPDAESVASKDMFKMLCEQVAMLADTQACERERMERENKASLEAIRLSIANMSQQTSSAPHPPQGQAAWPLASSNRGGSSSSPQCGIRQPVSAGSRQSVLKPCALEALGPMQPDMLKQDVTPQSLATEEDPVHTLRRHRPPANQATAILKELALMEAGSKKRKGEMAPHKSSNTQIEADWPDLYIYRLGGNELIYGSLTLAEFVAGYLSIVEEVTAVYPINDRLLKHISYLRQLMEDCFLANWHAVRTAHKHVLNTIKHHRFLWEDTVMVLDTKRTALNRILNSHAMFAQPVNVHIAPAPQAPLGAAHSVVCIAYQQLACPMLGDHDIDGTMNLHYCNFCLSLTAVATHIHSLSAARQKRLARVRHRQRNTSDIKRNSN